ncbi:hypothetical protein Pmar_PMAR020364 [Perkinsus marinus ATCC 50983]|uniref:Uncharacterized protein n=1 Tax=Perkinsus marinus (strain ATCC 50983 / TXsc) TaxID=423536 RepID=C5LU47_PERM5|nr:hypothetical protein Pmar_PMAR020364 [Perkinsus marinus ATCC 50983]EEQ99743.1 hypothetical protein Pmar_PMAR020364 [Perkinsus marinus ATCC 50983]|eukprot:XP_002767026.1 hypothetical protein Pmar_PMAR020364 [Perkinsus marinus ATCC 50983]
MASVRVAEEEDSVVHHLGRMGVEERAPIHSISKGEGSTSRKAGASKEARKGRIRGHDTRKVFNTYGHDDDGLELSLLYGYPQQYLRECVFDHCP